MSTKGKCFVVLTSLFVGVGTMASPLQNAKFSYRAEVPSGSGSCEDNAKTVANLFQKSSGAAVTASRCVGQNTIGDAGRTYTRDIVTVDYVAPNELTPTKTIFGGGEFLGRIYEHSGFFSSYAGCLSQLAFQKQNFENATGLTSLVSYCEDATYLHTPSFSLVIESFGVSKNHLYLYADQSILGALADPNADLLKAKERVITDAGGHVVMEDASHIFYYNNAPVSVGMTILSYFPSTNQCTDQQAVASAIYTNAGVPSVTALCINDSLTVVSAYSFNVQEYISNQTPIYSSYLECMGDRGRVLQNFTSRGGKPLGVICAQNIQSNDQYQIRLFYKGH